MFYIDKRRKRSKKDLAVMHLGPTLMVFIAFLGLTVWIWVDARANTQTEQRKALQDHVTNTNQAIQARFATYDIALRAGKGLFEGSQEVTNTEWQHFIQSLDLADRYPGATGIGYAPVVTADNKTTHIRQQRQTNHPTYAISPDTQADISVPVIYFESFENRTSQAIGFDLRSEERRQQALDDARDSGEPAMTAPLWLLRDQQTREQPGHIIFVPVYRQTGTPAVTVQERRNNLIGYVYLPFRYHDLIQHLTTDNNQHYGFSIADSTDTEPTDLYQSNHYQTISHAAGNVSTQQAVTVNNRQWNIHGTAHPHILPLREVNRSGTVLWGGIALSFFVASFIYLLLLNRTRLIANKEAGEIQEAKDELLALASHQLRTPATGVKQYIGMLREGYAGKLTTEQRQFVEKAYTSNERQLNTINEMLVVARADAGQLEITKSNIDLNDLVLDVIEEQHPAINARDQLIESYVPKQHLHIYADPRYLRMAIENIVNNASKYTHEGGTIIVTLLSKKKHVHISVRDTGVGISKTDEALLFQKFSRIPNELTGKVGGSGIGLYLAQKIIDAHYGRISVDSEPGEGSVFTIILPVRSSGDHPVS